MIDEQWLAAAVASQQAELDDQDVAAGRLRSLLAEWALGFAESRSDVETATVVWPRRGIHPDEATAFLRGVDSGHVTVDSAGYVSLHRVRAKTPSGRYALLSKSGAGVSVNLEYLIQIGAVTELVEDLGWPPDALDFERGEFDVLGMGPDDRVTLAVEAKARVTGNDSLEKLVRRWLELASSPHRELADNPGRKYRELGRLCEAGPVTVWLVAAGARWSLRATLGGGRIELEPTGQPMHSTVTTADHTTGRRVLWIRPFHADLHRPGTQAAAGQCSWFCNDRALYSVRVRETAGGESSFGLCEIHRHRVEQVYGTV